MALKLPTLLEGEALVAWLGISADTRRKYAATKQALTNALKPTEFLGFAEFQSRKLRPGETVHMHVSASSQATPRCSYARTGRR